MTTPKGVRRMVSDFGQKFVDHPLGTKYEKLSLFNFYFFGCFTLDQNPLEV